jgi:hypothetical protein
MRLSQAHGYFVVFALFGAAGLKRPENRGFARLWTAFEKVFRTKGLWRFFENWPSPVENDVALSTEGRRSTRHRGNLKKGENDRFHPFMCA